MTNEDTIQVAFHLFQQGRFVDAEKIYEHLLRQNPNNHDALHYFGILKASRGQFKEARAFIERSLDAPTTNLRYVENYVSVLFQIADYQRAADVCVQVIDKHGRTESLQYLLAISLHKIGFFKEAVGAFDSLLSSNPNHLPGINEKASTLSELGQYREALACVENALRIDPNYAEAILNKGNILAKLRKFDESIAAYKEALSLNPDLFDAYLGYGNALRESGRFGEALVLYDQTISLKPELAEGWLGRGNALAELKRTNEAFAAYEQALVINPDLAEARLGRGLLLAELKKFEEAFVEIEYSTAIKPKAGRSWLARGNVHFALKRFDEALAAYDRALALQPDLAEAWLGLGNVFVEFRRFDEAIIAYDKALANKVQLAEAWLGRGNAHVELKRFDEALSSYDKALELKSDLGEASLGRGNVFTEFKRFDEAFAAYDAALAIDSNLAAAWLGRGNAFTDLKRFDEAFAAYDNAIGLDPKFADAYWGKSLAKLCVGDFKEGWDLYEWRAEIKENQALRTDLNLLKTSIRLDRNVLRGKRIAILSEQGIGDEAMFASILPDLLSDAHEVHYEVDPRLEGLFARSFPEVKVIPRGNREYIKEQNFDLVLQSASLGYTYRTDRMSFPSSTYLRADPKRIDKWKSMLPTGTRPIKIGISWRGGTDRTRRNDRSVGLERLRPLIKRDDCYFVNLQYGDVGREVLDFNERGQGTVHNLLEDTDNFEEFAALIMALDLVVSVQNTTIHMCGALGKTCLGMIPWRPEWRYGSDGSTMVWYPSVELYRQTTTGDWEEIITAVNSRLNLPMADTP